MSKVSQNVFYFKWSHVRDLSDLRDTGRGGGLDHPDPPSYPEGVATRPYFFQMSEGGTPGACFRGRGFERFDKRALFEKRMDDVPLNPLPFSVNDSNLPEPFFLTFCEILLQERRNLLGQEGVKIDPIFDRNFNNVR